MTEVMRKEALLEEYERRLRPWIEKKLKGEILGFDEMRLKVMVQLPTDVGYPACIIECCIDELDEVLTQHEQVWGRKKWVPRRLWMSSALFDPEGLRL